jgi:hypothetical protein
MTSFSISTIRTSEYVSRMAAERAYSQGVNTTNALVVPNSGGPICFVHRLTKAPLTDLTSLAAPPAVLVLKYRADHGPRPILLNRHMEFLVVQRRFNIRRYRVNGLCVSGAAAVNSCNSCLCKLSSLYNDREAKERSNVGVQRRRIIVSSTGRCGRYKTSTHFQRLSPRGRLDPTK